MKTIRSYKTLLGKMKNAQHFQFHHWIVWVLGEKINEVDDLKALFNAYKLLFDQEDELQKRSQEQEGTERIKELDFLRDRLFASLNTTINAAVRDVSSETQPSATALQKVFHKYRGADKKDYVSNTSDLVNLGQDLRLPENAVHVEALGLAEMTDRLDAINEEFDEVYNQRMDWVGDQAALGNMAMIRPLVDEAFGALAEAIESLYKANELTAKDPAVEASLGHLIDQINNRLNQMARVSGSRTSSSSGNGNGGNGGDNNGGGGGWEPENPDESMYMGMYMPVTSKTEMLIVAQNKPAFHEFAEENFMQEAEGKGLMIVERLPGGATNEYFYPFHTLDMMLDEDFQPMWSGVVFHPREGYQFVAPFEEDVLPNPYTVYLNSSTNNPVAIFLETAKPKEVKVP